MRGQLNWKTYWLLHDYDAKVTKIDSHYRLRARHSKNSQHRSIAFVPPAQYGHIRGDKTGGDTSRRPIAARQPGRQRDTARRPQPDVRSQRRRSRQRVPAEEETATLSHDIHQLSARRARKGILANSLSRRLHQVSSATSNLIKRLLLVVPIHEVIKNSAALSDVSKGAPTAHYGLINIDW